MEPTHATPPRRPHGRHVEQRDDDRVVSSGDGDGDLDDDVDIPFEVPVPDVLDQRHAVPIDEEER